MFSRFFNSSLPHAVDAPVGPAVTLLEPMPDFGAFGTDDPSLLAVTGSVIIIHVQLFMTSSKIRIDDLSFKCEHCDH